ncbi:MAG: hypothetical protein AB1595_06370 [bacterium]
MLTKEEESELRKLSTSSKLKKDMEIVSKNKPYRDINSFLEFLKGYNELISHKHRRFRKIVDKDMRL